MTIALAVVQENIAQSQAILVMIPYQIGAGRAQKTSIKEKIKRILLGNNHFIDSGLSVISSLLAEYSDSISAILGEDCALW